MDSRSAPGPAIGAWTRDRRSVRRRTRGDASGKFRLVAGGTTDILGRMVSAGLTETLGQSFVVEN
ncbi:MAG: hypothetical protein ABWZ78_02940 [Burkholderiaceae bacterium]